MKLLSTTMDGNVSARNTGRSSRRNRGCTRSAFIISTIMESTFHRDSTTIRRHPFFGQRCHHSASRLAIHGEKEKDTPADYPPTPRFAALFEAPCYIPTQGRDGTTSASASFVHQLRAGGICTSALLSIPRNIFPRLVDIFSTHVRILEKAGMKTQEQHV